MNDIVVIGALLILGAGALVGYAMRRLWTLLIPVPAVLAGPAWYWWEFSNEAVPFAAAILILGYVGLAIGAGLQRAKRGAARDGL